MSRRPNVSTALALKAAAAAAAARDDEDDPETIKPQPEPTPALLAVSEPEIEPPSKSRQLSDSTSSGPKAIGRPRGRRAVAARQTVYLDDARHAALARIAEDRGRSIHSLIIEGIDHMIGKPIAPGWK